MHHGPVHFDTSAVQAMLSHPWPGNVRELDNAVQRALILQSGTIISSGHLRLEACAARAAAPGVVAVLPDVLAQINAAADDNPAGRLNGDLRLHEFDIIVNALKDTRGSKSTAAERLGISARTLRYKLARMRESGLDVETALSAT